MEHRVAVRMHWFWTAIFLTFTFFNIILSEAKHHPNKLPLSPATVVGTVHCNSCFPKDKPNTNHVLAGATVAVECKSTSSTPPFRQQVETNTHGEFRLHLPFPVTTRVKTIRGCSVALLRSNEPFCASAAPASLRLQSRNQRKHVFSTGFIAFKPQLCNRKMATKMAFILPPNPLFPPPSLIPPVIPTPPPSIFPPIFPTPPPSIFPPIFPSPPPSVIPPILPTPSPPPAPFFPLPPLIPWLIPSPPPPPPPSFPVPLPPVPFLPPLIPGGPPHVVSSEARTSQP